MRVGVLENVDGHPQHAWIYGGMMVWMLEVNSPCTKFMPDWPESITATVNQSSGSEYWSVQWVTCPTCVG